MKSHPDTSMGEIHYPPPVKPICAILFSESVSLDPVIERLESLLGRIDLKSDVYPFLFTDYYSTKMKLPLKKFFVSFGDLMERERLPEIKKRTNELEDEFSEEEKGKRLRLVNLDPGYIGRSKLVLASTKNFSHRIYLGGGIFAEVTLVYTKGNFLSNPWTFKDYRTELALFFFRRVRERYMAQLIHGRQDA
ncbi:MAG: DUF4416 family protein [Acidobacteriota bacterium]